MNNNTQFKGLWAVILGGSGGFGFAAAKKLAGHGMNIAVLYRENAAAERAFLKNLTEVAQSNEITVLPYNINALEQSGRELFLQNFADIAQKGTVKMLLHSISRGNLKPLITSNPADDVYHTLSAQDIEMTSYAMANSLLDWARLLLQAKLFHQDGRIIGLTSEGAHKYWESYAAVSIAKASLESLCKYMAVEFSGFGLKTNLIQAGVTDTASLKRIPGSEKLLEMGVKRNPMGRLTSPQDVANVIYLLCTDEAAWVNGSLIHVDGGEHCN